MIHASPADVPDQSEISREYLIGVDQAFPNFEWKKDAKPESLRLNQAGFFEGPNGNWYLIRNAKNSMSLDEVQPSDLYNGKRDGSWNATEGSGLYFANYPEAASIVPFVGGKMRLVGDLYIGRVRPGEGELLDATHVMRQRTAGHQAAALLLRARSIFPAIPNPGRRGWNRLYGDTKVVTTRPLAAIRALSGFGQRVGNLRLKPRWAIVRDLNSVEIVAKKPSVGTE